jgi:hypothetical protein
MPFVPNFPGVPPLSSYAPATALALLVTDAWSLVFPGIPQWGIFFQGVPVVVADSVISFEYKEDWSISSYPVEQGGFETYNKVAVPFDVRVTYSAGGTPANRQALQASVDAIMSSLDLFDVVTPEKVFLSVNPTHQDFRRTSSDGVGLLRISVWCEQVRVTAQAQFSNTQSPSGASAQGGGFAQTSPASPAQAAMVPSILGNGPP